MKGFNIAILAKENVKYVLESNKYGSRDGMVQDLSPDWP